MVVMSDAELFAGLTIERDEALPQRVVAGRTAIPNPFVDAVHDSYREAMDQNVGPAKAVRSIHVPVNRKNLSLRTQVRKAKNGTLVGTQWQQDASVTTAINLLNKAAAKNGIGVRIVVDYDKEILPELAVTIDGVQHTLRDVTLHKFKVGKDGRVRVRFLGQKRKQPKPKTGA